MTIKGYYQTNCRDLLLNFSTFDDKGKEKIHYCGFGQVEFDAKTLTLKSSVLYHKAFNKEKVKNEVMVSYEFNFKTMKLTVSNHHLIKNNVDVSDLLLTILPTLLKIDQLNEDLMLQFNTGDILLPMISTMCYGDVENEGKHQYDSNNRQNTYQLEPYIFLTTIQPFMAVLSQKNDLISQYTIAIVNVLEKQLERKNTMTAKKSTTTAK